MVHSLVTKIRIIIITQLVIDIVDLLLKDMDPDNIERYDRQIRLWGHHGQSKCANSKICLINANSLGTEILKGLCLAGVGSFTILDSHKMTPEDVGCNFLPHSCIGRSRGESARNMLLDLNEEVSGEVFPLETYLPHITQIELDCDTKESEYFKNDLSFWKQFNCVIASGFLYIDQIVRLSKICWTTNTPLILCKSIGFYGSLRLQISEHLVIETHPDNVLPDFNLDRPFSNLKEYFDSIDLENEENIAALSKYPYVVVVYKYLRKWQKHKGFPEDRLPNCHAEKRELKSFIDEALKALRKKMSQERDESESNNNQEMAFENYFEASKALNSCLSVSSRLPESVISIFNHPKLAEISVQNPSRFWLIIKALKEYVMLKNDGCLPISGSIPDMTSSSEEYIRLQSIYARKAREDVDNIFGVVQTFIDSSNCSPGSSLYDETKLICKNIRDLQMFSTYPIYQEYEFKACNLKEEDEEDDFILIGLGLKSLDSFFSTYGRLPGCQDDQVETDVTKLKDCIKQMIGKASNGLKNLDQCLYELCRYGGAELHATSAFIGGCVAQEVIKLITNQYIPVNDTLVYDALSATTKSFRCSDVFLVK